MMRAHPVAIMCALALSACNSGADDNPVKEDMADEAEQPGPAPAPAETGLDATDITGEWRVAGINGEALSQPYGMAASITARRISVSSQCVNFAWNYELSGGSFTATQAGVDEPVCERMRTDDERALDRAIPMVNKARRTATGALELTGDNASITFFTQ